MPEIDKSINAAVPLYVGYGLTSYPQRDASRLTAAFGYVEGHQLEDIVKALLDELNQLRPDWTSHTLESATKWAGEEMKRKHPELDANAIAALEWAFSWGWK